MLARGIKCNFGKESGNLNKSIFKSSNARALPGGGGGGNVDVSKLIGALSGHSL